MISRATLFESPGGDTIQLVNTAESIKKKGHNVDIKLSNEVIDYSNYDIAHFFNIIRPNDILQHISKMKIPYVVSTIYVDYSEGEKNSKGIRGFLSKNLDSNKIEYLKALARHILGNEKLHSIEYIKKGHKKSIIKIAKQAALLLPNSKSEYFRFSKDYSISCKYINVPNAIDTGIFNFSTVIANNKYRDFVICAARIEPIKNQLNLIKAINQLGYKLLIVGKPSLNHQEYYKKCLNEAKHNKNITFVEHIQQDELARIYKAAKVHVLPSWFETTGLSSLEAAALHCNIVVSKKGDTYDYFKDYAWYCEPNDINSIKKAIADAYNSNYNQEFVDLILEKYNWEQTAEYTIKGYKQALNNN